MPRGCRLAAPLVLRNDVVRPPDATRDAPLEMPLLLHRREIDSLYGKVREKGLTVVPTRLYFKDGRVKIELAVARGKEQRDKRRDVVERDAKRQIERALKGQR